MNNIIWPQMRYTKTDVVFREKTLETSGPKNYFASQIGRGVTAWLLWAKCIIHTIFYPWTLRIRRECPKISRAGIKYCVERLRRIAHLNRAHIVVVEKVFQIDFYLILMTWSSRLSKFSHLHRIRFWAAHCDLCRHFLIRQVCISVWRWWTLTMFMFVVGRWVDLHV